MAKEKEKRKSITRSNTAKIVGYLKENNLERVRSAKDMNVIRGAITVAINKISSYKVQFYIPEFLSNGDESKDYQALEELLPENTITVASYLKQNAEANFDAAITAASRVWVMAHIEEYASRKGERVTSAPTLRGFKAGFAKGDKPFTTCAEFDVDIYVNNIEPEVVDEQETGRLLVEGLIPKYNGSVDKVDFIAVAEDGVAAYVKANYHCGDTVNIRGDLVNIQERIVKEQDTSESFGRPSAPTYDTKFIKERRILGGTAHPIKQGEEGCIPTDFIKEGLVKREEQMVKNGERSADKGSSGGSQPQSSGAGFGSRAPSIGSEDMDF